MGVLGKLFKEGLSNYKIFFALSFPPSVPGTVDAMVETTSPFGHEATFWGMNCGTKNCKVERENKPRTLITS